MTDIQKYLDGHALYGDDFSATELARWWDEEEEGYSELVLDENEAFKYPYFGLNNYHAFSKIQIKPGSRTLGFGSALGHEFLPVLDQLGTITIVDPSDNMAAVHVIPDREVQYVKPRVDGTLPFASDSFDLITCFGVLHHVANVSAVVQECYRCLAPGGLFLCREPIVTQGDWRQPRVGLTKNERGIPLKIFDQIIRKAGFSVERSALCIFPPLLKLLEKFGVSMLASTFGARLDAVMSRLFASNVVYHRVRLVDKFAPAAIYYVVRKPAS